MYSATGAYRTKHAGCDWLMFDRNGNLIGLLHYYDLSLETFNDNDKRCSIGLTVAEPFRRNGFGEEAIRHLLKYIYDKQSNINRILAYTDKRNEASAALFRKLNFTENQTDYLHHEKYFYFIATRKALAEKISEPKTKRFLTAKIFNA
jgi:RimJ/RimL family protein N-acetyltransferase